MKRRLIRLLLALCVLLLSIPAALAEPVPTDTPTPYVMQNAIPTASLMPTAAPVEEDAFLSHAVEIAHRISVLAANPHAMAHLWFEPMNEAILDELRTGDHTKPQRIFHVSGEELIRALYGPEDDAAARLDFTRPELRRDLVESLPDMLLGRREIFDLQVLHYLARYKTFAETDVEGCGFFIMLYGEDTPVVLPWYTERGAASIAAFFMPDDELKACTDAEAVSAWFAGKGLPAVRFEEIKPGRLPDHFRAGEAQSVQAVGESVTLDALLEMPQKMAELVNGDLLAIQGVPAELRKIAEGWAQGSTQRPRMVVRADAENAAVLRNTRAELLLEPDIIRLEMESYILTEIVSSLMRDAAEEAGVTAASYGQILEVNGLIDASVCYAQQGVQDGYALYFLLYEDGTPVMILANQENGAVSLNGFFLPSERLSRCENVGQVALWMMSCGFTMPCRELPMP